MLVLFCHVQPVYSDSRTKWLPGQRLGVLVLIIPFVMFMMQAYERGVPLAEELKLAPFCQVEFAATDISPATANTATAALFAAFGQDQVSELRKAYSCRRMPELLAERHAHSITYAPDKIYSVCIGTLANTGVFNSHLVWLRWMYLNRGFYIGCCIS